ncbi:CBS domain-containing protein [Kitasatospora sp. RB6PN24]|uniref:CBS domain-containing protein n=1 Tax=Kitasatospora humi TaxID=2893891 RepID=UPI001E436EE9|nr:CBS domain-containing protein [Kitasatospora humi]MCC9306104.1 CBS domain-containing protein [Kitasatospora humi]
MTRRWTTVGEVMTHAVIAVGRDAGYRQILEKLQEWRVSAVPVLAGDGRVIGVVSEADLLLHGDRDPGHAGRLTARELMSAPAVCVHPDSPTALAAREMAHYRLKRLPVIDGDGLLVGIVSRSDLLKVYLREDQELADQVRFEVLALLRPEQAAGVEVSAMEGRISLTGTLPDADLLPVLERMVRAVPGVVDVEANLVSPVRAGAAALR